MKGRIFVKDSTGKLKFFADTLKEGDWEIRWKDVSNFELRKLCLGK